MATKKIKSSRGKGGKSAPSTAKGGGKSLIVVESPSKAKTIHKYVGKGYSVLASVGHVKDLPKKKLGVAIENHFKPEYVVIAGKDAILNNIKKEAKKAEKVYLAPDPDREGEAIAYHIAQELNGGSKKVFRVLFNEITEKGIRSAMASPGKIDLNKVNAQQARRVLDRIVGYKISPLLWEKVRRGLSAGRVQSVAVRLICEREVERAAFVPEEYWSITAELEGRHPPSFQARLVEVEGREAKVSTEVQSTEIVNDLRGQTFRISQIERKDRKKNPLPPFITSRLQQEASRKLRFTARRTMMIAQQLYEGIELGAEGPVGLITYMRTDSTRVAQEAAEEARSFVAGHLGEEYVPDRPQIYANKKRAQDAHEAIRPTSSNRTPDHIRAFLTKDQYELYKLIWYRFVACQMAPAELEMTRVDIAAGRFLFRANGSVVKFAGFTALYREATDDKTIEKKEESASDKESAEENELPTLAEGEVLRLHQLIPKQHFTQPPPRYTEALLIKELEEQGIGRPSTYHTILSTIVDRRYVEKDDGRLHPTDLGKTVNELLVEHFPELLSIKFTARMEGELDEVEEGEKAWEETLEEFYKPFSDRLSKAQREMRDVKREEIPTEIDCEKCGKKMVIKWGRHGRFLACPGYPECKNTKEFVEEGGRVRVVDRRPEVQENCPESGHPLVIKTGKFGRFLACSDYPNCKFTKALGTGVRCTQAGCDGELVEKRSRRGKPFYGCSRYPKCTFALWDRPLPKPCPQCQAPFLVVKFSKRAGKETVCLNKECGYRESEDALEPQGSEAVSEENSSENQ